jgi:beta-phosphoglucomutase
MLRAIIFDFDGVIVDTERWHFAALQRVLAEEGIPLTWDEYTQNYLAMDDKNCLRTLLVRHGRPTPPEVVERFGERKAHYFFSGLPNTLTPFPGVEDFTRRAAAKYPLAIASGSLREEIEFILAQVRLREFFPVIVAAQDVMMGKPDPEPYLAALGRLNRLGTGRPVRPSECLVIEDSRHGVASATAAGMRCLAVTTSYPPEALGAAHLVVESLCQLDLAQIETLFA